MSYGGVMAVNRPKAGQQQFQPPQFPMMSVLEINNILEALGIIVKPEDISKPNSGGVHQIWSALLECLMGYHQDFIEGPKTSLLMQMEYKDLYSDALSFTMFYQRCKEFLSVCGITNFSIADLTRPDPQRFRLQLSGVMNFAKFREERAAFQSTLQSKVERQREKSQKLRDQVEKAIVDIEEIKAKHALDRPLTEAQRHKNEALHAELIQLRSDQVKATTELQELKEERVRLMEQNAARSGDITHATNSIGQARSRLVQSPDRIKKEISEMSHSVAQERISLAQFQQKSRELNKRLEVIKSLEVDLRALIDVEKGVDEMRMALEKRKRSKTGLEGDLQGAEIETDSLESKIQQLTRQIKNAEEKTKRQQEMKEEMHERAKAKLETLKQEYSARAKERTGWQKEKDKLHAQLKEVEAEIQAFTQEHEAEINTLMDEYMLLRQQATDYMDHVTAKLDLKLSPQEPANRS